MFSLQILMLNMITGLEEKGRVSKNLLEVSKTLGMVLVNYSQ